MVSKSKLDCLGLRHDITVRIKKFRQYMSTKVRAARRFVYELAKPITGAAVEGLLKDISGVPTQVCPKISRYFQ